MIITVLNFVLLLLDLASNWTIKIKYYFNEYLGPSTLLAMLGRFSKLIRYLSFGPGMLEQAVWISSHGYHFGPF
jgi:hypothetical protein